MHMAFGGMWTPDLTRENMQKMSECAIPLIRAGKPIYALADFTDSLPQDRESAEIISEQLNNSKHFGLKRVAVINASPLMTMQYKRVSKGIEVEFFSSKIDALHWLRTDR